MLKKGRWLGLSLVLVCSLVHAEAARMQPTPQQFFAGSSEGHGVLNFLFGKSRPFHVESLGVTQADGSFRLDQTITFEGKPPTQRYWLIRNLSKGEYAGTLSDAAGAVNGRIEGRRLILRYRIKGLIMMQQTLEVLHDGNTIGNLGKISVLGIPIGRLNETIVRRDPESRAPTQEE